MDIKDDSLYPIKEAIILTGISRRSLSRKAKAINLRQPFGIYLYTGFELKALIKQKEDREAAKEKKAKYQATLKNQATNQATNKVGAPLNIADLQNLKLDDIEDFEFKFRRPGEFPKEGREQKEFYKGPVEYYQKLASQTLGMQSTLIETLSNQTKANFIESTVRAKNTEWKKGTEPNKKGK